MSRQKVRPRGGLWERVGRDGVFRGDATSLTGTSDLKLADAKVAMPAPLQVHVRALVRVNGEGRGRVNGLVKSAGRQGPTS